MTTLNGAQMVTRALEDEGVSTVFGIPGGSAIHLYDAIYDANFKHILMRHEQAAVHAADGYARASGQVGVCIATSGPGALNLITGIATANLDSVPVVAITGQVATDFIGTDYFQEADVVGCSLPLVKHSFQVRNIDQIQKAIHKAFYIARTGRPGPVLVDVPTNVQRAIGEYSFQEDTDFLGYKPKDILDLTDLDKVIQAIEKSERPVILSGGGVISSDSSRNLENFAVKYNIPVATTMLGKGSFPESHKSGLALGMAGMHGHPVANFAIQQADLVIAIGTRFSDRTTCARETFAKDATLVHIDVDAAEFHKVIHPTYTLLGSAPRVLSAIFASLRRLADHTAWIEHLKKLRKDFPLPHPTYDGQIAPWQAIETLREVAGSDAIVTTEVGLNQLWAAQLYKSEEPRSFISSGGLGTMGFGFPAAIGACFAQPSNTVCCVAGDGSLMMNIAELDTCARYDIPVKVLLLNNISLGNVRQWQQIFYDSRYSNTIYNKAPDFEKLAESMGVMGVSVSEPDKLKGAIEKALKHDGPALIDVRIPQGANVMPMVNPGNSLTDMNF